MALLCIIIPAWLLRVRQLKKDVLYLRRLPGRSTITASDSSLLNLTRYSSPFSTLACPHGPVRSRRLRTQSTKCRFMHIDAEVAAQEPFAGCRLLSASQFVASLDVPGGFNWHKAARTVLVHLKLTLLLPVVDIFLSRAEAAGGGLPSATLGPSAFVYLFLRDAVSPLHFYSLGALLLLASGWHPPLILWTPLRSC